MPPLLLLSLRETRETIGLCLSFPVVSNFSRSVRAAFRGTLEAIYKCDSRESGDKEFHSINGSKDRCNFQGFESWSLFHSGE